MTLLQSVHGSCLQEVLLIQSHLNVFQPFVGIGFFQPTYQRGGVTAKSIAIEVSMKGLGQARFGSIGVCRLRFLLETLTKNNNPWSYLRA